MPSGNFNSKTKIFIRYPPGAAGHFLGYVIWCLLNNKVAPLQTPEKALHEAIAIFETYHNFRNFWDYGQAQQMHDYFTSPTSDRNEAVNFFKTAIEFYPTELQAYIISIHSVDPTPVLLSQENTKLVNITVTNNCLDQISYNWFYKTGYSNYPAFNKKIKIINEKYGKLKDITISDLGAGARANRLKTYLQRFTIDTSPIILHDISHIDHHSIKFSDIMDLSFIDQLDSLIQYLELTPSNETISDAKELIKEYVSAQRKIPWILNINDYE